MRWMHCSETGYPLVDEALGALQQVGVGKHSVRDWLALLPRVRVIQ